MFGNRFRSVRPRTVASFRPTLELLESRLTPSADVLAHHNDLANTGVNPGETVLTPANVSASSFGKLFSTAVDGIVFAEPVLASNVNVITGPSPGFHDVVFVATEHDSLYAIDAHSGQVFWHDSFLTGLPGATVTPIPSSAVSSTGVGPEVGITGTPVIDPTTQTLYLVSETQEVVGGNAHYIQRLHAVGLADGSERAGGPVVIANTSYDGSAYTYNSGPTVNGTGAGSVGGRVTYNALRQLPRASLTLNNGTVYMATAGHSGDIPPYHGWVLGFDAATLQIKAAFNTTPNGSNGGIWQAGGSLSIDPQGFLYAETGNGDFDTTSNAAGLPSRGDYGDTVLKLAVDPSTSPTNQNANGWGLKVVDYFTPFNQATLDSTDLDLGSQAPVILPDSVGSAQHPHLLIAAGKEGKLYLIDRDNMGHFNAGGSTDKDVQTLTNAIGGVWGTPAFFNNLLYYLTPGANGKAFTIANGSAQIIATPAAQTPDTFAYPGATPAVSASGTANGIVWTLDKGSNQLRAYAAGNLADELYTSGQAAGGRDSLGSLATFATPAVANGMVFVGTTTALVGYGLLAGTPPVPTGLAVTASGSTATLTWNASAGASSYNVYRGTTSGGEGLVPLKTGVTATTFGDSGLSAGVIYYYQVGAVGPGGESERSGEAATGLTPNESFVRALYVDFLGREGTLGELDAWVRQLPNLGQEGVAAAIDHSPESAQRLVSSYYVEFLGRSPASAEANGWVNLLTQPGTTQEQVIAGFLASMEFARRADAMFASSNSDTSYVLALYSLLLHRSGGAVSSSEVNGWLTALPSLGRSGVAQEFLGSSEFRSSAVRTFYGDRSLVPLPAQPFLPVLLHRGSSPAASEVAGWVGGPLDLFGLEAGFAGSAEFFNQG